MNIPELPDTSSNIGLLNLARSAFQIAEKRNCLLQKMTKHI